MLVPKKAQTMPRPSWHAPWKLSRVISGHGGWVRCLDMEPGNEWFVTGSGDRVIKIWDLASGTLKLSLTGHISTVRGVCVSPRQPYLFSVGEDKQVKCWDLEYNKVRRTFLTIFTCNTISHLFSTSNDPSESIVYQLISIIFFYYIQPLMSEACSFINCLLIF